MLIRVCRKLDKDVETGYVSLPSARVDYRMAKAEEHGEGEAVVGLG